MALLYQLRIVVCEMDGGQQAQQARSTEVCRRFLVLKPQCLPRCVFRHTSKLTDVLKQLSMLSIMGSVHGLGGLGTQSLRFLDDLQARYVTLFPYGRRPQGLKDVARSSCPGLAEVEDLGGEMVRWFNKAGFVSDAVAILRPDKFAFAVVPAADLEPALQQLRLQLQWTLRPAQLSKAA